MAGESYTGALKVLSSLAISHTPTLDVGVDFLHGSDKSWHAEKVLLRRSGLKPLAYFLALHFVIGHEDLILMFFVAVSKDISALNDLWVEAEDVVDGEDSGCSIGRTRDTYSAYVSERVVCYVEVSEGADMSSGHRG